MERSVGRGSTDAFGAGTVGEIAERWWEETVPTCSELIRIDTQIGGPGERTAAEWVGTRLSDVGLRPELVESEPGRSTLVARVPGLDDALDPLLIQMHLDVVPAQPHEWSVHPLSGEVEDGYLWGRGAVDMKNMVASVLTLVCHRMRTGRLPRRPLVLAFFADEENAGVLGAQWAVQQRPDLFEGCRVAIGEGGGYSVTLQGGRRLYPVHVAEKGWTALEVTAQAAPAHASRIYDDNPVRVLGEAIGRLTADRFPVHLTDEVAQLLRTACEVHGVAFDPNDPEAALSLLGDSEAASTGSGLRHTAHATRLAAGYQSNVIPGSASAELDGRYLPGRWEEFLTELQAALGDRVQVRELARTSGLTPVAGGASDELFAAAADALRADDATALVSPFMSSGGTDATHLQRLGIECFGFNPLLLPEDLDFQALFHGIDERVPVAALQFATRVLDRFVDRF